MEENILYISEGREKTDEGEFSFDKDITGVSFPSSLKRISERTFIECKNVKFFDLPNGLERIDNLAFLGTNAVIFVPKSVKYIGSEVFSRNNIVFFECQSEKDFVHFERTEYIYDYPDSYNRGPSMGGEEIVHTYYEHGCQLLFNKTHDEFLEYIRKNK